MLCVLTMIANLLLLCVLCMVPFPDNATFTAAFSAFAYLVHRISETAAQKMILFKFSNIKSNSEMIINIQFIAGRTWVKR